MEITYDSQGKGSNGSSLIPGKIYMARANGAPDKNGKLRESTDSSYYEYKAVKNGSLFTMWPQNDECYFGYRFPHYMFFKS